MLRTFPQLQDTRIEFAWTGNFLLTLSRLPQVGRLGDNLYYSQGCSGHGVTYTHLAGKVLAEALRGQAERFDAFARLPHYPFPGGRLLRVPFTAAGAPGTPCAIAWGCDVTDGPPGRLAATRRGRRYASALFAQPRGPDGARSGRGSGSRWCSRCCRFRL